MEDNTETTIKTTIKTTTKTTVKTIPNSPSTLSTIPRLYTIQSSKDLAIYFSIIFYNYQYTSILGNIKFGYIRYIEGIKVIG